MARHFIVGIVALILVLSAFFSTTTHAFAGSNGIFFPQQNVTASGSIDIEGSAHHPSFRKWQIDLILDGNPSSAAFVAVGDEPIDGSEVLTTLDTTLYPNGEHQLRLRVVHSNLNYDEYFTPIRIENEPPALVLAKPTVEPKVASAQVESFEMSLYDKAAQENVTSSGKPALMSAIPAKRSAPTRVTNSHTLATRLDIPFDKTGRWIEVDLATQTLRAWEADQIYMETLISSGKEWTPTVQGVFHINQKLPSQRMTGPDYDLSDVKAVMYFFSNYAIHGAYWHNDFGTPTSHGCVNMRESEALDLFDWASVGTPVFVYE